MNLTDQILPLLRKFRDEDFNGNTARTAVAWGVTTSTLQRILSPDTKSSPTLGSLDPIVDLLDLRIMRGAPDEGEKVADLRRELASQQEELTKLLRKLVDIQDERSKLKDEKYALEKELMDLRRKIATPASASVKKGKAKSPEFPGLPTGQDDSLHES